MKCTVKGIFLGLFMGSMLLLGACAKSEPLPPVPQVKPAQQKLPKVALSLWVPKQDEALTTEAVAAFKAANRDKEWEITLEVVEQEDLEKRLGGAEAAGVDVFSFPHHMLANLHQKDLLKAILRNTEQIQEAHAAGAIQAATRDKTLYAYPLSLAGGNVLYYDTSVISEEQVKTVEGLLVGVAAGRKKLLLPMQDAAFVTSFFLSAGNQLTVTDGKVTCNFNNTVGQGVATALQGILGNKAYQVGGKNLLADDFLAGSCGAAVGTMEDADEVKNSLGENYGVAVLPSFSANEKEVPLNTYMEYVLVGVHEDTEYPIEAMMLAEWITSEAQQQKRLEKNGNIPTNKAAAASSVLTEDLAGKALYEQSGEAILNKKELTSWMPPVLGFTTNIVAKSNTKTVAELMDAVVAEILTGKKQE